MPPNKKSSLWWRGKGTCELDPASGLNGGEHGQETNSKTFFTTVTFLPLIDLF